MILACILVRTKWTTIKRIWETSCPTKSKRSRTRLELKKVSQLIMGSFILSSNKLPTPGIRSTIWMQFNQLELTVLRRDWKTNSIAELQELELTLISRMPFWARIKRPWNNWQQLPTNSMRYISKCSLKKQHTIPKTQLQAVLKFNTTTTLWLQWLFHKISKDHCQLLAISIKLSSLGTMIRSSVKLFKTDS